MEQARHLDHRAPRRDPVRQGLPGVDRLSSEMLNDGARVRACSPPGGICGAGLEGDLEGDLDGAVKRRVSDAGGGDRVLGDTSAEGVAGLVEGIALLDQGVYKEKR